MVLNDQVVGVVLIVEEGSGGETPEFLFEGLAQIEVCKLSILIVVKLMVAIENGSLIKIVNIFFIWIVAVKIFLCFWKYLYVLLLFLHFFFYHFFVGKIDYKRYFLSVSS